MSAPAFYLPPNAWSDRPFLPPDEAAHANVLRLADGDMALLLDGCGKIADCRIIHMRKKKIQLEILHERMSPRPKASAVLAVALSKAVRRNFFMEKAAELGAAGVWLWQAERSQGRLVPAVAESCRGQLVAGMKQSLNPWLPELEILADVNELAHKAATADWRVLPWENQTAVPMLSTDQLGRPGRTVYVIGPEGGFTEAETSSLFAAGFNPVSLGARVLRCETAATLCLGLHWWASQLPGHPDFKESEAGL